MLNFKDFVFSSTSSLIIFPSTSRFLNVSSLEESIEDWKVIMGAKELCRIGLHFIYNK